MKANFYYIIPTIWALIILILSLLPGKDMPSFSLWEMVNSDKVAHFGFYGIQAYLLARGLFLTNPQMKGSSIFMWAFILVVAYGGLIEVMQGTLCADRYADILDFLANTIGAGLGLLIYRFYPKLADFSFRLLRLS